MIVSKKDSVKIILKWRLFTIFKEMLIILFFWGIPFWLIYYNELLGMILFFCGVFMARKLINYIENYIGVYCSMQNPNKNQLVQIDVPYPPWIKCAVLKKIQKKKRKSKSVK